jgi:hypothetical protein
MNHEIEIRPENKKIKRKPNPTDLSEEMKMKKIRNGVYMIKLN